MGGSAVNTAPTEKVQVKIKSGINREHQVELKRDGDQTTTVVSIVMDSHKNELSNGSVVAEFQDMDTYGDFFRTIWKRYVIFRSDC